MCVCVCLFFHFFLPLSFSLVKFSPDWWINVIHDLRVGSIVPRNNHQILPSVPGDTLIGEIFQERECWINMFTCRRERGKGKKKKIMNDYDDDEGAGGNSESKELFRLSSLVKSRVKGRKFFIFFFSWGEVVWTVVKLVIWFIFCTRCSPKAVRSTGTVKNGMVAGKEQHGRESHLEIPSEFTATTSTRRLYSITNFKMNWQILMKKCLVLYFFFWRFAFVQLKIADRLVPNVISAEIMNGQVNHLRFAVLRSSAKKLTTTATTKKTNWERLRLPIIDF